jgi:hypothetical protein
LNSHQGSNADDLLHSVFLNPLVIGIVFVSYHGTHLAGVYSSCREYNCFTMTIFLSLLIQSFTIFCRRLKGKFSISISVNEDYTSLNASETHPNTISLISSQNIDNLLVHEVRHIHPMLHHLTYS